MKILVVNAGSSSLKYQLLDMETESVLAKGNAERIGLDGSFLKHKANGTETVINQQFDNHSQAIQKILNVLTDEKLGVIKNINEIDAFGHRVVSGAEKYTKTTLVTPEVIEVLKQNKEFAPLHMMANIAGIEGCMNVAPQIPNAIVFDTAFHSTMPDYAYLYGIPMKYYEDFKIRRYGAHGTSHKFVAEKLANYIGKPFDNCKLITCHIGNGSSISAVKNGKCIDTSMGLTPLAGVLMGTRCGDIDPSIVDFLCAKLNKNAAEVTNILNKESGLQGISELSSDMRDLLAGIESGNQKAKLALDMLAYQIKKYIGSYVAALDGVDGICFTAGIGENTPELREMILTQLNYLGIKFDREANYSLARGADGVITTKESAVPVYVISTNEELAIARETMEVVNNLKK